MNRFRAGFKFNEKFFGENDRVDIDLYKNKNSLWGYKNVAIVEITDTRIRIRIEAEMIGDNKFVWIPYDNIQNIKTTTSISRISEVL